MEGIKKALPQTQHSHIANTMIKQLREGEITLKEYFIKCAYWGMKTLDDIYFRSLPTKPLNVIEFEQIPYSNRQKLGWGFFTDHPGIIEYYEELKRVKTKNNTDLYNLRMYKEYIPGSDVESHKKLDERIMSFKIKMEGD